MPFFYYALYPQEQSLFLLLFASLKNTRKESALYSHSSNRAELLAAEALYTLGSCDFRLAVFDNDRLGGAYLTALVAAYAKLALKRGL